MNVPKTTRKEKNEKENCTTIGEYAFYDCEGLTSITIPNSVTTIGDSAFSNCTGLTTINVDSNNQSYTWNIYHISLPNRCKFRGNKLEYFFEKYLQKSSIRRASTVTTAKKLKMCKMVTRDMPRDWTPIFSKFTPHCRAIFRDKCPKWSKWLPWISLL